MATVPVGYTLSVDPGTWDWMGGVNPSFTYQWTSDGGNIGGATLPNYTAQTADIGHAIGCTVTAHNDGGTASVASSNTVSVVASSIFSQLAALNLDATPLPVIVTLDRGDRAPLDLTPMIEQGSLTWSSVVPGGFADCSFQINGDFRQLMKRIPYLSIVRVIGDSGRILFEGQIEDLNPTLSDTVVGVRVGAFGLQNILKEVPVRTIWSKRDMQWVSPILNPVNTNWPPGYQVDPNIDTQVGQVDQTDLTKAGVQVSGRGTGSTPNGGGNFADWYLPLGASITSWRGTVNISPATSSNWEAVWYYLDGGAWTLVGSSHTAGPFTFSMGIPSTADAIRVGAANRSGGALTVPAANFVQFYDMRVLGVIDEDTAGGFYGDTLIKSLLSVVPGVNPGVIESGSDFTIDHLDASTRRFAYDILEEITRYYTREWAVWEDGLLNWQTADRSRNEWIIPVSVLNDLNLDASTQNSQQVSYVLYTDAATGLEAEASINSTDRRNPYVLNNRVRAQLTSPGFPMTASTAAKLALKLLNDIGFGPVPAAGTISLPGETIIDHASGTPLKAWEIRAGDNVTIPELPMQDVFTQDGRGEALFHVVSAEGDSSDGSVKLQLDSYGSKRSDVLIARLAAVTNALGG